MGQVIFSIRGLYLSIVGEDKQSKSIIDMLTAIKEERKKLKEYLELFQKKIEETKKAIEKKENWSNLDLIDIWLDVSYFTYVDMTL